MHTCDLSLIEKWDENQSQKILNQYVSNIKNSKRNYFAKRILITLATFPSMYVLARN